MRSHAPAPSKPALTSGVRDQPWKLPDGRQRALQPSFEPGQPGGAGAREGSQQPGQGAQAPALALGPARKLTALKRYPGLGRRPGGLVTMADPEGNQFRVERTAERV